LQETKERDESGKKTPKSLIIFWGGNVLGGKSGRTWKKRKKQSRGVVGGEGKTYAHRSTWRKNLIRKGKKRKPKAERSNSKKGENMPGPELWHKRDKGSHLRILRGENILEKRKKKSGGERGIVSGKREAVYKSDKEVHVNGGNQLTI